MPDQSSAATEHAILQEIIAPLEALPEDPLAIVRADFPTALRGYDRVAVEEYVRKTSHLVAELQATRSPEAAVRRALERVGEQITGILQRAHETAEQITVQSRREAEDRLEQARAEAAQIAGAAQQRVTDLDADTDRIWVERQRIMADAEDLAAQMLALARTAADRFPADEDREDGIDGDDEYAEDHTLPYDQETATEEQPGHGLADDPKPRAQAGFSDEPETAGGEGSSEDLWPSVREGDLEPPGGEKSSDEPEPPPRDEIDRTVAFRPLEPEPEARAPEEPPASPQDPAAPGPPPGRGRSAQDEPTAVIPPASQAANRRVNP